MSKSGINYVAGHYQIKQKEKEREIIKLILLKFYILELLKIKQINDKKQMNFFVAFLFTLYN